MLNSASEIRIPKRQMQALINKLMFEVKSSLYWRYNNDVIYLVVDTPDFTDELIFKKDGDAFLNMDKGTLDNMKNKNIKEKVISYLVKNGNYPQSEFMENQIGKSKKHLEIEINYYLMELLGYLKDENEKMANETKCKLSVLSDQLDKFNS